MYKASTLSILILFLSVSCQKEKEINNFPSEVKFSISGRLLEGKHITCFDSDAKGNIYIASDAELYYKNKSDQKSYTLGFPILDLAIAPDETVWIGTNGGGLAHLTGEGIIWYTKANAALPRDYIRHVEIASDGNVWFTSCAYKLGGLGIYDGEKFEFLTPENSPLNQNIIEDLEIGQDGTVYIATTGTTWMTNIYRIKGNTWNCLGDEKGTFYWVFSISLSPSGILYLVEDFSLSSAIRTNNLFRFEDNKWQKIEAVEIAGIDMFARLNTDKRNFCWIADNKRPSPLLHVYTGKSWITSPEDMFPEDYISVIGTDSENNIWVGTNENGIFILNQ
jgi:ligand-binding sensor domain-containing protein